MLILKCGKAAPTGMGCKVRKPKTKKWFRNFRYKLGQD